MFRAVMTALALLLSTAGCGGDTDGGAPSKPTSSTPETGAGKPALAPPAQKGPTNLLLVTLDTTRADALGAYGQRLDASPEIDRLASGGVLFEQVVSSSPQTLPSHATLFTGTYPHVHGVRANSGYVLSQESVTIAEVLRDAGYRTGAEVAALVMQEVTQIAQGFDHYRGAESPGVKLKKIRYTKGKIRETELPVRVASDISRRGIEFIRDNRNHKFFLWLHYYDPHDPYSAPASFNAKIPESPYHAELASADFQIGLVIDELERLGLRDRTLVVLTSDHGEGLGDHGERTHSYFVYQSTMRVPLILWGPSLLPPGTRIHSLVRTVDIAPTILELLGLPIPGHIQGISLRPLLVGEKGAVSLTAYGESIEFLRMFGTSPLRFVREGRWKYIHKVNPELYDLEADPGELANLASQRPEVVERLRARLEQLLAEAPPKPSDAEVPIDDRIRAQLAALGYGARGAPAELRDDAAGLELSGGDPLLKIEDIELIATAMGLLAREEYDRASEMLEPLKQRNPDSAPILAMLAQASTGLEREEQAVSLLKRVIELDRRDILSRRNLASLLEKRGDGRAAVDVLLVAVELGTCLDSVWADLDRLLRSQRRYAEQLEVLERGAAQCPDSASNLNNYAWALATSPDDSVRDGAKAVEIARRAIAKTKTPDPGYIDTLAAAHAEAGDLAEAIRIELDALRDLESKGAPKAIISVFREHLSEFEAGRPLRDSG